MVTLTKFVTSRTPRVLGTLLGVLLVLVLSGCGAAYNPFRAEVEAPNFVPEWYLNPPEDEDFLYASAKGRSANPSQAIERARRRATGQFMTVLTEAVGQLQDSHADTGGESASPRDAFLNRVESNPPSVFELEARRVSRAGDEYRAHVLLRASWDDLFPSRDEDDLGSERGRLREYYQRLIHERTAARGAS